MNKRILILILSIIVVSIVFIFLIKNNIINTNSTKYLEQKQKCENLKLNAKDIKLILNKDYDLDNFLIASFNTTKSNNSLTSKYLYYKIRELKVVDKNNNSLFEIKEYNPQLDDIYVKLKPILHGKSEYKILVRIEWLDPEVYNYLYSSRTQNQKKFKEEDLYTNVFCDIESDFAKIEVLKFNACDFLQIQPKKIRLYENSMQDFNISIINNSNYDMNNLIVYFSKSNDLPIMQVKNYSKVLNKDSKINIPFVVAESNSNNYSFGENKTLLNIKSTFKNNLKCDLEKDLIIDFLSFSDLNSNLCDLITIDTKSSSYLKSMQDKTYILKIDNNSFLDLKIKDLNIITNTNALNLYRVNNASGEQVTKILSSSSSSLPFLVVNSIDANGVYNLNYNLIFEAGNYDLQEKEFVSKDIICNYNGDFNINIKDYN